MRVALDTNILAYAEGVNDPARKIEVIALLRKLSPSSLYVPLQALAELFQVLVRKGAASPSQARSSILEWCAQYEVIETSQGILLSALDLVFEHRLRIWDGVILAASASAGCRLLLSEDLHDGFTWGGVTVVNPFSETPNALLLQALDQ